MTLSSAVSRKIKESCLPVIKTITKSTADTANPRIDASLSPLPTRSSFPAPMFCPLYGAICRADRLDRTADKGIDTLRRCDTGYRQRTKTIDCCLDNERTDRCDGILQSHRYAHIAKRLYVGTTQLPLLFGYTKNLKFPLHVPEADHPGKGPGRSPSRSPVLPLPYAAQ